MFVVCKVEVQVGGIAQDDIDSRIGQVVGHLFTAPAADRIPAVGDETGILEFGVDFAFFCGDLHPTVEFQAFLVQDLLQAFGIVVAQIVLGSDYSLVDQCLAGRGTEPRAARHFVAAGLNAYQRSAGFAVHGLEFGNDFVQEVVHSFVGYAHHVVMEALGGGVFGRVGRVVQQVAGCFLGVGVLVFFVPVLHRVDGGTRMAGGFDLGDDLDVQAGGVPEQVDELLAGKVAIAVSSANGPEP